jgi:Sec-independent protein secretion pathway component TatC
MILLYEVGIWAAHLVSKRDEAPQEKETTSS